MGYTFKRKESVRKNFSRIAIEQVEGALSDLDNSELTQDQRVHQVRKTCKKMRGLLRLVRPALDDETYERENAAFRDAADLLSAVRDADTAMATVDRLATRFPARLDQQRAAATKDALVRYRASTLAETEDDASRMAAFRREMLAARKRIPSWRLSRKGFAAVRRGLSTIYERGFDDLEASIDAPETETLHDWRKYVKYHWYLVRLLEPIDRKRFRRQRRDLKRLSELLGDDHDLAVLSQILNDLADQPESGITDCTVRTLAAERRCELQAEAFDLGRRVYEERPRRFTKSASKRWKAWRSGS